MIRSPRSIFRVIFASVVVALAAGGSSAAEGDQIREKVMAMLKGAMEDVDGISVKELAELMEKGKDYFLIDNRTEAEYEAGHLRGAEWIPRGKMEVVAAGGSLPTDTMLIIYCKKHFRSALGAAMLKHLGFEKVKYLTGGFDAWAEAGHSIFNEHGELTVKNLGASEGE